MKEQARVIGGVNVLGGQANFGISIMSGKKDRNDEASRKFQ
jgi:hypothetical protein